MGVFDFLKKKDQKNEENVQIMPENKKGVEVNSSQNLVPFLGNQLIPENIRQLLWFADGKYKNYNPNSNEKVAFENELFRITFSFNQEPSLISTTLPITTVSNTDKVEKLGYYPSYVGLNPEQRYVYLHWLCDITKPIDIGYVFIFYYGLERHLISGKYKDAINTILTLRQYHNHPSFQSYSANALVMSSVLHKDKDTLIKVLNLIGDTSYCNSIILLGKYLMQMDLTVDEIINMSSAVGFTNKRYIKDYPELFKKSLESILINKFGKNTYPIYQLEMQYPFNHIMSFANISLDEEVRSPVLPDLLHSPEFSSSIDIILTMAHNEVKQSLAEMRKSGTAPAPKSTKISETGPKPECPYCHNLLDKMPQSKKKCPHCKNTIIVRTDPVEKKKILLREDQLGEFEERILQVRSHKKIQNILTSLNIDSTQFEQTKENIEMKIGKEPTEKEVALEIVDHVGYHYFKNLEMGLFRNTILNKGDIFKASGDLRNALIMYLELCYIDLNGPSNSGSLKGNPELLKQYPPFNPNDSSAVFLAPGILQYIHQINKELNLSKEENRQVFLDHNMKVQKARKLPLSVQDAWDRLEREIFL